MKTKSFAEIPAKAKSFAFAPMVALAPWFRKAELYGVLPLYYTPKLFQNSIQPSNFS